LAVGLGNQVHAAWFTRDEAHIWQSDWGRYQVWAAHRLAEAPALAPVPTLAPTPTPAPTAEGLSALPPTPLPPFPEGSAPPEGIFTDVDDALRLAVALSPVAGLTGAVFIARKLKRGRA
jgi:hypothetical protein